MSDIVEELRYGHEASTMWHVAREAADTIERLRAENTKLRKLLFNVSRGVHAYRVDANLAAVWLPVIQEMDAYIRDLDEAAAIRSDGDE